MKNIAAEPVRSSSAWPGFLRNAAWARSMKLAAACRKLQLPLRRKRNAVVWHLSSLIERAGRSESPQGNNRKTRSKLLSAPRRKTPIRSSTAVPEFSTKRAGHELSNNALQRKSVWVVAGSGAQAET